MRVRKITSKCTHVLVVQPTVSAARAFSVPRCASTICDRLASIFFDESTALPTSKRRRMPPPSMQKSVASEHAIPNVDFL